MEFQKITSFDDFSESIIKAGFSISASNDEGIFSVSRYYGGNIVYHTEDIETDPWEWRIRTLNERNDIAYSKLFFNKGGYISKQWYPYFLAVRRGGKVLEEDYYDGNISLIAKKIYDLIEENGTLPMHTIKQLGSFSKDDKSKFDRAITLLQMKMYITMCGSSRKTSKLGEQYGWSSTIFCTTESFFGSDVFAKAETMTKEEAVAKITERIYLLNPSANSKKVGKFIGL